MTALPAAIERAARAITRSGSIKEALTATRRALEKAGIGISNESRTLPPGGITAGPDALLAAAVDGRKRAAMGRLTLHELGASLAALGLPTAPDTDVGEQMRSFLQAWSKAALRQPDDPDNFNVLLLAALAREQKQPVDLLSGTYDPSELYFGDLDLDLIYSGLVRGIVRLFAGLGLSAPALQSSGATGLSLSESLTATRPLGKQQTSLLSLPTAADATGPCSQVRSAIVEGSRWYEQTFFDEVLKRETKSMITSSVRKIGLFMLNKLDVTDDGADQILRAADLGKLAGQLLKALNIAGKVQRLAELYQWATVSVKLLSPTSPVHERMEGDPRGTLQARFKVTAGVSDQDWNQMTALLQERSSARKAFADCAKVLGIPVATERIEVGKEAAKWHVAWQLLDGRPEAADFGSASERLGTLTAVNDHLAEHTLTIDIKNERKADHNPDGRLVQERVLADARVITVDLPKAANDLLISTLFGGPSGLAFAGTVTGLNLAIETLLLDLLNMRGYDILDVTHHKKGTWVGWIRYSLHGSRHERIDRTGGFVLSGSEERTFDVSYKGTIEYTGVEGNPVSLLGSASGSAQYSMEALDDDVSKGGATGAQSVPLQFAQCIFQTPLHTSQYNTAEADGSVNAQPVTAKIQLAPSRNHDYKIQLNWIQVPMSGSQHQGTAHVDPNACGVGDTPAQDIAINDTANGNGLQIVGPPSDVIEGITLVGRASSADHLSGLRGVEGRTTFDRLGGAYLTGTISWDFVRS